MELEITRQHRAETISNNTAYCLLVLIGMGYLFPLASIVQAYDAWVRLFPNRNVEFVLSAVYMGTNLITVLVLTLVPVASFRRRILQGFVGQFVGLLWIPTLLFFTISESVLFIVILASVAFEAIVTSLLDSSLLAYCAQFPDTFSHGVEFGIGLSYFVSCVYRIVTKIALSDTNQASTIVYFYAGAGTIFCCILSFQYLDQKVGKKSSDPLLQDPPKRKQSQLRLEASILNEHSSKESVDLTLTPSNLNSRPTLTPTPTPIIPPSPMTGTPHFSLSVPPTPDLRAKFSTSSNASHPPPQHHSSTASSTSQTLPPIPTRPPPLPPRPRPLPSKEREQEREQEQDEDETPLPPPTTPPPISLILPPPPPTPSTLSPPSTIFPPLLPTPLPVELKDSPTHSRELSKPIPSKTKFSSSSEACTVKPPFFSERERQTSFVDSQLVRRRGDSIQNLSWKSQRNVLELLLKQYYVVLSVFFVNGCLMPGMIASIPSSQLPQLEENGWFALSLLSTFAFTDLIGRFCARYEHRMRSFITHEKLWKSATIRNFIVVPPMLLCIFKIGFTHDAWAYFWTSVFGWTNGLLNVTCITSVFQRCDALLFTTEEKHFSGRLLSFVILLGLTTGAECGLGLSYILP